jgi:glycosyltransferase involved in cell wall biosynthesis
MRVLVLSNLYPPNVIGGYERLCFEVSSALAARGHDITVLTSRYGGKVADYPGQHVLRELDLLTGSDIYTPFAGTPADRERINTANLAALRQAIDKARPDVVFAWNLFFLDASLLCALKTGPMRTVVMLTDNWLLVMRNPVFVADFFRNVVHGSAPFVPPPPLGVLRRAGHAVRRLLGRTPPGLEAVFGSAFVRDLYAAGGSVFPRHRVIHNGVRQGAYALASAPDRARLVQPGTLRLLFAGRLVDLKGAHTAVAAMPLLDPAQLGVERVVLTLLGNAQDAAYMRQLDAAIQDSRRRESIVLEPAVPEEELPSLFGRHDIYLFPSLYEPFSLTLIHALASGIPTVASRAGGNVEIVRDGEGGLLFDKGDPAGLAACVRRLALDGGLRARLAVGGRRAAGRFTFDRMVDEMTAFLAPS